MNRCTSSSTTQPAGPDTRTVFWKLIIIRIQPASENSHIVLPRICMKYQNIFCRLRIRNNVCITAWGRSQACDRQAEWKNVECIKIVHPEAAYYLKNNLMEQNRLFVPCDFAFRIVWKSCSENIRAVHELSNFCKDPEFAVIVKIGLWPRWAILVHTGI